MKKLCHERLVEMRVVRNNWAFCYLSVIGSLRRRNKERHQVKSDLEWLVFFFCDLGVYSRDPCRILFVNVN